MLEQFRQDVLAGLSASPKYLPSRYFYDAKGDALFQQIMALPEYYLTRAEMEIFTQQAAAICENIPLAGSLQVFELGAGDGLKTIELLRQLTAAGHSVQYCPIDISANALELLAANIRQADLPLQFNPICNTYLDALAEIPLNPDQPKLLLFLGSNLGNLTHPQAIDLLHKIAQRMTPQDNFLLGIDLMKDPATILAAYNDQQQVTAQFNLNLLQRINRELGGDFDLNQFIHYPLYNPETGTTYSYLVSKIAQNIYIDSLGRTFRFEAWETIHTEISQKYSLPMIRQFCKTAGLNLQEVFLDSQAQFAVCRMGKNM
ncbi:MAG TPA: L-histidine N(alpha)-methyltransferase [Microscillaceae bacterium]|jgi:dimethylhistidine N-methyltransferase|nr:L-histidine N(alpha)-methyltransferase [Microscillaceae bacterium]